MRRRYKVSKILASVFMSFFIFVLAIGYGFAEDQIGVTKKDSWKEIRIDEAYLFNWCGNRQLILEGGGKKDRLIDIYTRDAQQLPVEPEYYGCSLGGRYVFSQKTTYKGKKCEGLAVYDTKTKQVQCLSNTKYRPSLPKRSPSLLSPDGKYLAWNSKEKIKLPWGEVLTLLPILEESEKNKEISNVGIAWSPDSKKVFLTRHIIPPNYPHDQNIQQELVIYDVLADKQTVFKLKWPNDILGGKIKLSPDGKKLYIQAGVGYEEENSDLYMLDLSKLDLTQLTAMPRLLMKNFWAFDIGSDNLIIFHKFRDPEAHFDPSDIKNAGLYLSDSKGKIIQRLTHNTIDLYPKFSKDGQAIAFRRTTVRSSNKAPAKGESVFGTGMPNSVNSVYILLRGN